LGVTLFASLGSDAALLDIGASVAAVIGQRVAPKL